MSGLHRLLEGLGEWTPPRLPADVPHGDMPGDKVCIGPEHIRKANVIFPALLRALGETEGEKAVAAVFGGSGVGKSETASILAAYLREAGVGSYVMSGDNYPHRIPMYNDAERVRIFRTSKATGSHSPASSAHFGTRRTSVRFNSARYHSKIRPSRASRISRPRPERTTFRPAIRTVGASSPCRTTSR